MRHLFIFGTLIISCLFINCNTQEPTDPTDPIYISEQFQSWEDTQQPAGDPLGLSLATYAKVLCTAVFESGRDPNEAFENSGRILLDSVYFSGLGYQINNTLKTAIITWNDTLRSSATYVGDQGCIIDGEKGLQFKPVSVGSQLGEASTMYWPMGDKIQTIEGYDQDLINEALDLAFDTKSYTAAFVALHKGEIIAERYGQGADMYTQLESWSMGKSLTATLIGRLIQQGKFSLDDKAPIKEWSAEGDPRGEITIRNLLQMSSGLRFPSHRDPEITVPLAHLPHMYIYTAPINVFEFAVNRPLEFIPGTTGRYRNCDPLSLGYIIKTTVESDSLNYHTWPQKELFDKIGIRRQLLETDPYGNFIMSGFDYGTARNWARLGLLYLQNGLWEGERLLPEGFAEFVSTHAASWEQPVYGGMFWLNGTGDFPLPSDAYAMMGAGGQRTIIVPSLDLVIVRMGHSRGSNYVSQSLNSAAEKIAEVIEKYNAEIQ